MLHVHASAALLALATLLTHQTPLAPPPRRAANRRRQIVRMPHRYHTEATQRQREHLQLSAAVFTVFVQKIVQPWWMAE